MRTQLLLIICILGISFNAHLQRKLATVTKESCEKEGKDFQEAQSAQCKAGSYVFKVTKKDECVAGKWTEGYCSLTEITKEEDCQGNPIYTAAQKSDPADGGRLRSLDTSAKCTTKSGYEIQDEKRLSSETECQEELKWTAGKCSNAEVKTKSDCEKANPEFIDATEATCVEKKTDFKIALVFITCLLF